MARPGITIHSGTDLTIEYSYTLNRIGRAAKNTTDKQLRKGLGGLAEGLQQEAERSRRKVEACWIWASI